MKNQISFFAFTFFLWLFLIPPLVGQNFYCHGTTYKGYKYAKLKDGITLGVFDAKLGVYVVGYSKKILHTGAHQAHLYPRKPEGTRSYMEAKNNCEMLNEYHESKDWRLPSETDINTNEVLKTTLKRSGLANIWVMDGWVYDINGDLFRQENTNNRFPNFCIRCH